MPPAKGSTRSRKTADPRSASSQPEPAPLRLGFAVKVLGRGGLKSNDSRRWQKEPHLRVSLEYLREVFAYLGKCGITMYRMSSDLAPYLTHPDMPQFRTQIAECARELRELGEIAARQDLRLSFHPSQYIILNSVDEKLTRQSIHDLESQAEMLDCMGQGPEGVVVIHVGGVYGDRPSARERWARTYERLSARLRRRLVLENDDASFSAADVLQIHEKTGVPLVFDHQHFWCHNPERLDLHATVEAFLRTWATGVRPKVHFSSPRTELREIQRRNRKTGKKETVLQPPLLSGHADYNNPFEFAMMMRQLKSFDFDVMLEAKAKDLALLRLRTDLARCAPDVAARFGISSTDALAAADGSFGADPNQELPSPSEVTGGSNEHA